VWDVECVDEIANPRVVVCRDTIRLAMGHRWNSYVESHVNAVAETMTRALLYEHDVLLDETNTTKSSVMKNFLLDPDADYHFVDTSPDICKSRARTTNQEDLFPVIDRMYDNLARLAQVNPVGNLKGITPYLFKEIELLREKARVQKEKFERIV